MMALMLSVTGKHLNILLVYTYMSPTPFSGLAFSCENNNTNTWYQITGRMSEGKKADQEKSINIYVYLIYILYRGSHNMHINVFSVCIHCQWNQYQIYDSVQDKKLGHKTLYPCIIIIIIIVFVIISVQANVMI